MQGEQESRPTEPVKVILAYKYHQMFVLLFHG